MCFVLVDLRNRSQLSFYGAVFLAHAPFCHTTLQHNGLFHSSHTPPYNDHNFSILPTNTQDISWQWTWIAWWLMNAVENLRQWCSSEIETLIFLKSPSPRQSTQRQRAALMHTNSNSWILPTKKKKYTDSRWSHHLTHSHVHMTSDVNGYGH